MDLRVRNLCVVLWIAGLAPLAAEQVHQSVSIEVSPMKYFMGLVNMGIEYRFLPGVALDVYAEYELAKADHPDLVAYLRGRWYPFSGSAWYSGLQTGAHLLYTWSRSSETGILDAGLELGMLVPLADWLTLNPHVLVSTPLVEFSPTLGFEMLVRLRMGSPH